MILNSPSYTRFLHNHNFRDVIIPGRFVLLALMLICFVWSCKRSVEINTESLYGKWDIEKAERNGKKTPYLRGGYFIIEPTGFMTYNITGSDEKSPFVLHEQTLRISEEILFEIESLQADSMTIRYKKGPENEFLFYLYKTKDETQ